MGHGCSVDVEGRGAGGNHVRSVIFIQVSVKCVVTEMKYSMAVGWVKRSIPLLPRNKASAMWQKDAKS
jgi:hypothetical protein